MRKLKYAILGLVNRHPITGYDITKEFNKELSNFWYAGHSQIYPELQKLTDEGLITFETVIQGEKLEKKLYSITDQGKTEFTKWLVKDEDLEPTPKDVFKLRSYYCESINKEDFNNLLSLQKFKRNIKLKYLEDLMSSYIDIPKFGSADFGTYIVLEGAIFREKSYIDWLNKCLEYIDN